jgi:uncharacterized membrane protein YphA (DoxX/SURF4 family)
MRWSAASSPAHGSQKVFGTLGGYGLEGTGEYLEAFGLRPDKLFAFAARPSWSGAWLSQRGSSRPARRP